ncbi:phoenix [Xyrauchen texanus]|uniref:phoenix n=1 Tax=Xyrauchen texanus TaxID=154827 RepID=UPI0022428308|nr:phoenix [Xyrauchen texanus]
MDLTSDDDITYTASPNTIRMFADIDPSAELIFETPPPDVVSSITKCFEPFTNTFEKRSGASFLDLLSDSDSGESLFLTQAVTSADRTVRRRRSKNRSESISDNDCDEEGEGSTRRGPWNEATECEEETGGHQQHKALPKGGKKCRRFDLWSIRPKRALFPFMMKSKRQQVLTRQKHQILENSEIGGFLKCIKKTKEGYTNTGVALGSWMLESELIYNSEVDERHSDHEVSVVDRDVFVPGFHLKGKQIWCPQSVIERRKAVMPLSQYPDMLQPIEHMDIEKHVKNPSKKNSERKIKVSSKLKNSSHLPQSQINSMKKFTLSKKTPKAAARKRSVGSSKSDSVLRLKERQKQQQHKNHETSEVSASCSDSELSDSAHMRHPHLQQMVWSVENSADEASDGGDLWVIEETQTLNSVDAVTEEATNMMQEDELRSRAQSNFCFPPHGGDISIHKDTHYTDGSLFSYVPLDNVIRVKKTNKPNTFVNAEVAMRASSTKHSETSQSSVDPHTKLLSEINCQSKRRSKLSLSQKCIDVTCIEETTEMQPASECLPLADEVEDKGANEKQTAASVSQSGETADYLKIMSNLSVMTDSTVIPKVKKNKIRKHKINEQEDTGLDSGIHCVEDVQSIQYTGLKQSESKTTELSCKKKQKVANKERNGTTYAEKSIAINNSSNNTFDFIADRAADLRVNDFIHFTETNELERISEDNTGSPNVITFNSVKKKKRKKKDLCKQYESIDLDLDKSSVSMFGEVTMPRVLAQQESTTEEIIEERLYDDSATEHLESNSAGGLSVAKRKKKSKHLSSDIRLGKAVSESQLGNTVELLEKTSNLSQFKPKIKKMHKLKEQENSELDSDTQNVHSIESETSMLPSRRTKKKKKDTMISPSKKSLDHIDQRPPEMRANYLVQSYEAIEIHPIEPIVTSEEIAGAPSVTRLKSLKKRKKKDRSEKHRCESVHLDPDGSSLSLFDVTGLRKVAQDEDRPTMQEIIEERQCLKSNTVGILSVAKCKKKSQNGSSSSQGEDIIGLEKNWTDSPSGNTAELLAKTSNLSVVLDTTVITHVKKKKKKKHEVKEQENAELDSDTQNVHSIESETSMLPSGRTKKKRKDKVIEMTIHEKGKNATISPSNKSLNGILDRSPELRLNDLVHPSEAIEMHHLEHIWKSKNITECPSLSVTRLKSVKKTTRKRDGSDSVDLNVDMCSVSWFDVNGQAEDGSTTQEIIKERRSDLTEHLESNTTAKLYLAKHKKQRERAHVTINDNSDLSCSVAQQEDTEMLVRPKKRKKKRNSDGIELTSEFTETEDLFENSQRQVSKPPGTMSKKTKRKIREEMEEPYQSQISVLNDTVGLETVLTNRTDSVKQQNNAERQVSTTSLGDSDISRDRKKRRKKDTGNNVMLIPRNQSTDSPTGVNQDDASKSPEKERQRTRCNDIGCMETEYNANIFQLQRKQDTKKENNKKADFKGATGIGDHSGSQTDDETGKRKKKRKREESASIMDTPSSLIHNGDRYLFW